MSAHRDNIVSMHSVSKTYVGVRALSNVDFELRRGEIHCLLGENGSGKSTLIKILCGVETPDAGCEIRIADQSFKRLTRAVSLEKGVNVIYQDLSLFPNLTVAENICFNFHMDKKHPLVNKKLMRQKAFEVIEQMGQELDPDTTVEKLSVADRQLVAICKALVGELKVLIMDEPTSSLTAKEVRNLFAVVHKLVAMGTTILFVSHKLEEVVEIADCVTILKDGKKVGSLAGAEITKCNIVQLMSGKTLELHKLDQPIRSERVILEVRDLCRKGKFEHINFSVREGEVIGITGLLGSGRTELALAIVGYTPADSGEVLVDGQCVRLRSICDGIDAGMALVSEDRLNEGLIMRQTVEFNLAITTLREQTGCCGFLQKDLKKKIVEQQIQDIGIKIPSVSSLSGLFREAISRRSSSANGWPQNRSCLSSTALRSASTSRRETAFTRSSRAWPQRGWR